MAFTVQSDPIVAGANSYASVADMKTYWDDRGVVLADDYADALIEDALVKATQYVDVRFGLQFVGYPKYAGQTTQWPRESAWDVRGDQLTGIPTPLKWAVFEYAYRALSAELMADPERDATGQVVRGKDETVGPIRERTDYQVYLGFQLPQYPLADGILTQWGLVAPPPARGLYVGDVVRA